MNMKKKFLLAIATAAALSVVSLTACSSDSSSSPNTPEVSPTDPVPADTTKTPVDPNANPGQNPSDPANPTEPGDTASVVTPPPTDPIDTTTTPADTSVQVPENPDTVTVPAKDPCEGIVPQPVAFPQDEFTDIGEVYKNIQCNEKVVFMIRHGERSRNNSGKESPLTEDGVEEAIAMGAKLIGPEEFKFIHTGFVRTYQTALYAAVGRGQAQVLEDGTAIGFEADTVTQLTDGWFMKDKEKRDEYQAADSTLKNVNVMYAAWAYDGLYSDVFYDLEERSQELLNTYVLKDVANLPKYTLIASHDQLLMPLLVYLTQKQIDLKLHNVTAPRNWLTFLAGVAIIINDKNELRYAPIKGGATGVE